MGSESGIWTILIRDCQFAVSVRGSKRTAAMLTSNCVITAELVGYFWAIATVFVLPELHFLGSIVGKGLKFWAASRWEPCEWTGREISLKRASADV